MIFEEALPHPEYLIKSIAEQGYSLETSLADLIDNSISAGAHKAEILINTSEESFTLFLADDGCGMSEEELKKSMHFPSGSSEEIRPAHDLGRFGLGLKTASFAQTRHLTVLSRKKGVSDFHGRTWNVDLLKDGQWKIGIESKEEISVLFERYQLLSKDFLNSFSDFIPNTIIIWRGLYKFENYLTHTDRKEELKKQITEVTSEYLSLVFHRFLERKESPLQLRVNNTILKAFNPFPVNEEGFRPMESNRRQFQTATLKIEGYILPSRSLDDSKSESSVWAQRNKSLTDMEGIYLYRADRIILYGGWNGIIKKSPRHQLARLKVDIGNSIDKYFHLNVAKSSVIIPFDLRTAFTRYIIELRQEAEKEYFNRSIKKISSVKVKNKADNLFIREASSKGMLLLINEEFPLLKSLTESLNNKQIQELKVILQIINTTVNKVRHVHEDKNASSITGDDGPSIEGICNAIVKLQENGFTAIQIKESFFSGLGIRTDSIPKEINDLLNK